MIFSRDKVIPQLKLYVCVCVCLFYFYAPDALIYIGCASNSIWLYRFFWGATNALCIVYSVITKKYWQISPQLCRAPRRNCSINHKAKQMAV